MLALGPVKERRFRGAASNTQAWGSGVGVWKHGKKSAGEQLKKGELKTEFLGQKEHSLRPRNVVFGLDRGQCLNNW